MKLTHITSKKDYYGIFYSARVQSSFHLWTRQKWGGNPQPEARQGLVGDVDIFSGCGGAEGQRYVASTIVACRDGRGIGTRYGDYLDPPFLVRL
jgi:hypothetical protein